MRNASELIRDGLMHISERHKALWVQERGGGGGGGEWGGVKGVLDAFATARALIYSAQTECNERRTGRGV